MRRILAQLHVAILSKEAEARRRFECKRPLARLPRPPDRVLLNVQLLSVANLRKTRAQRQRAARAHFFCAREEAKCAPIERQKRECRVFSLQATSSGVRRAKEFRAHIFNHAERRLIEAHCAQKRQQIFVDNIRVDRQHKKPFGAASAKRVDKRGQKSLRKRLQRFSVAQKNLPHFSYVVVSGARKMNVCSIAPA